MYDDDNIEEIFGGIQIFTWVKPHICTGRDGHPFLSLTKAQAFRSVAHEIVRVITSLLVKLVVSGTYYP